MRQLKIIEKYADNGSFSHHSIIDIKTGETVVEDADWFDKSDCQIAKAIHYPDCWDTAAYPSLVTALWELVEQGKSHCPTCGKDQFILFNIKEGGS